MPPSFRGKSIRFLYNLVVGTNRSAVGGASFGPTARGASSRVMRVPIRVYNHVAGELASLALTRHKSLG